MRSAFHLARCDDGSARPLRAALHREVEMLASMPLKLRYQSVLDRAGDQPPRDGNEIVLRLRAPCRSQRSARTAGRRR
jgi:hypothetical protein